MPHRLRRTGIHFVGKCSGTSLLRALAVTFLIARTGPAAAVAGGGDATGHPLATAGVMVLSSRGGVCSGVVVGRDSILTAGHCAAGGAEHRVHFRDEAGAPVLLPLVATAVHPGYDSGAIAGRRRSIDLALLRLASPLPARFAAAPLGAAAPTAGTALVLAGFGVAQPGDARSSGTFRAIPLPVVEPYGPSRILVWLKGARDGEGACEGDSGGPISRDGRIVAITTWASGRKGCGGYSQGVLLGPQRDWIDRTLSGWGGAARWE